MCLPTSDIPQFRPSGGSTSWEHCEFTRTIIVRIICRNYIEDWLAIGLADIESVSDLESDYRANRVAAAQIRIAHAFNLASSI
jgi:hypothetical protein